MSAFPGLRAGLFVVVLFLVTVIPGVGVQDPLAEKAADHYRNGVAAFRSAHYDHVPAHRATDAERQYLVAERELRAAIAGDPGHLAAHRELARLLFIRKRFADSLQVYGKVVELSPGDLDAHIQMALLLIELGRDDDAIQILERARGQTPDPQAQATLDGYIAKVRALNRNGGSR